MFMVSPGIPKIDFTMLDDGVRPIGDVKRAVWSKLHIDGTKGDVCRANQIRHFFGYVSRALLLNAEPDDAVGPKVARDEVALPFLGEVFAPDNSQAAEFRVAAG